MSLSDKQKEKIDNLILENKPIPADMTIGDAIKKALYLSDEEYKNLDEEIRDYVEAYFARIANM